MGYIRGQWKLCFSHFRRSTTRSSCLPHIRRSFSVSPTSVVSCVSQGPSGLRLLFGEATTRRSKSGAARQISVFSSPPAFSDEPKPDRFGAGQEHPIRAERSPLQVD